MSLLAVLAAGCGGVTQFDVGRINVVAPAPPSVGASPAPSQPSQALPSAPSQALPSQASATSPAAPAPSPAAAPMTATPSYVGGAPQPGAVALVIGIEKYPSLPAATGAEADAARFATMAQTSLGVPRENVRLLTNSGATKGSIERELAWAKDRIRAGGRLYFYFSGHGAPEPTSGGSYLVPVDGDARYLEQTALPMATVMKRLSETKARDVVAFVDSCFSGAGGRSVLPPGARPLVRVLEPKAEARVALFSASSGTEISGPSQDGSSGLFTKFLLQGIGGGAADADGDGQVSLKELADWVQPRVAREAKVSDNREQHPTVITPAGVEASQTILAWGLPPR